MFASAPSHPALPIRVLLIEDTPRHVGLIRNALEPYDRFTLDHVTRLSQFRRRLRQCGYDLILLDDVLPDGTGLDVLAYLAARAVKTPVIAVVGRGSQQAAVRMVEAGASDYVIKSRRCLETLPHTIARVVAQAYSHAACLSAIGELAAGVAHQINNPLTTILADTQLLLALLDPGHPGHVSASAILEAGLQAQRVVQRLVDFASADTQPHEPTDVNQTVLSAIDRIGLPADRSAVDLTLALADSLPAVLASGQQLEDVWVNLLSNARDAIPPGRRGAITVTSTLVEGGQAVEVSIADNGRGIHDQEKENVFAPFFTTKRDRRGNGLGLSVCRSIVQTHNGEIGFDSRFGQGTVFTVRLPLDAGRADGNAIPRSMKQGQANEREDLPIPSRPGDRRRRHCGRLHRAHPAHV